MNTELGVLRQTSNEEIFVLKPEVGKKASPKKLSPILCNLSLPPGCEVTQLASPGLCEDAPVALLLGGGEEEGEGPALGGVRTLKVALRACAGRQGMLQAARIAFAEAFRRAREHHSKGVYLIGHGIGALFAAKLLADKQFFEECPSSHLLQAVFLISGIYNFNNESLRSLLKTGESTNDEKQTSPPQNITRRPTMITNLVSDHQSFDDRNNLSFICDLSNRCSQFDNTVFSEFKKCKPVHGIELTPEETIKNSPIFQQVAGFNTKPVKMECAGKKCDERNNLSSSLEEIEIIQMLSDDSIDFSPLFDDYKHLQRMAMRVYVFAAEKDGACISKQSRDMFECLAEGCDQEDMHFEVKAKVDRRDVRELLKEEDNFLKRLIRYDVVKFLQ